MKNVYLVSLDNSGHSSYFYEKLSSLALEIDSLSVKSDGAAYVILVDGEANHIHMAAQLCSDNWSVKLDEDVLSATMSGKKRCYIMLADNNEILISKFVDTDDTEGMNKILHYIYRLCGRDFELLLH